MGTVEGGRGGKKMTLCCPKCECAESRVIDKQTVTRKRRVGDVVTREQVTRKKRRCRFCSTVFYTTE